MANFFSPNLQAKHFRNLKEHKYAAEGKSLLEPAFQKFWCVLVDYIPENLHPNLLTLLGLVFNLIFALPLTIGDVSLNNNLPSLTLLFGIVCIFLYQTLDAVDGKQARRLNLSSPLGELMDHGCDSISMVLLTIVFLATMGFGDNLGVSLFLFLNLNVNFYAAHWLCFVTGKIKFGKIDVTETLCGLMGIMLISALFGVGFWRISLGLEVRMFPFLFSSFFTIKYFIGVLNSISQGGVGKNGTTVADSSILSPGIPLLITIFMTLKNAWTSIGQGFTLYSAYPAPFLLLHGLILAKLSINLVVGHMAKAKVRLVDPIMLGAFIPIINSFLNYPFGINLVPAACLLFTMVYITGYFYRLCTDIAQYFELKSILFITK